jgi:hypothetical protein
LKQINLKIIGDILKSEFKLLVCLWLTGMSSVATAEGFPFELPAWFHRPHTGDSYNIGILKNGTFIWRLNGCDYAGLGYGLWRQEGNQIVLYGRDNKFFSWSGKSSEIYVKEVVVTPISGGIQTTVPNSEYSPVFWVPGIICAQCEGALLGPTTEVQACSQEEEERIKQLLSRDFK